MFDWLFGRSSERVDRILESNRKPPEWKTYTYDPDVESLTRERNLAVAALKDIAQNGSSSGQKLAETAQNALMEMVK